MQEVVRSDLHELTATIWVVFKLFCFIFQLIFKACACIHTKGPNTDHVHKDLFLRICIFLKRCPRGLLFDFRLNPASLVNEVGPPRGCSGARNTIQSKIKEAGGETDVKRSRKVEEGGEIHREKMPKTEKVGEGLALLIIIVFLGYPCFPPVPPSLRA